VSVTVLSGATVVTMDPARRVLTDGAVAFSSTDGSILAVGPSAVVREQYPGAEVVDCAGSVVCFRGSTTRTPHLFQTLLKGLGDDRVLSDWFTTITGPSAVELTEDDRAADRTQDHQMQLETRPPTAVRCGLAGLNDGCGGRANQADISVDARELLRVAG
jgi:cytosine/adenosine deaminase-related metal-dependent hydrolase